VHVLAHRTENVYGALVGSLFAATMLKKPLALSASSSRR
jgi:hypothetical protein